MGGFEDGFSVAVVDVGAGGDADAAYAGGEGVGDIVAVEVEGGDHVVFLGFEQDVLEEGIADAVFEDDFAAGVGVGEGVAFFGAVVDGAKLFFSQIDTPLAEGAFGEFHDVAFVHEGDGLAVVADGVFEGGADEALGAFAGYGFDADAALLRIADAVDVHFVLQEVDDFLGAGGVGFPFDAGVYVF